MAADPTDDINGSWLQRNARPLVLIWFSILIGVYWLGLGASDIPATAVSDMFGLIQLGLGSYVIGRSSEKIAKTLAPVLKR